MRLVAFYVASAGVDLETALLREHLAAHLPEYMLPDTFARLDRQAGGINFVNLRDLRRDLPHFGRAEFDMNLLELRRDRRYTLKAAEGLDGLAADERDAGIWEDGDLLLNVSRLRP